MTNCNICGGPTKPIQIKEQMMGLNETFVYDQCLDCGHTHLHILPGNMARYYDTKEYYSFKTNSGLAATAIRNTQTFLKKILLSFGIRKSFLFSSALKSLLSNKEITKNSTILDYGCGAGQFVKELNSLGFRNTRGFDPYLPADQINNGELLLTNDLKSLKISSWDIITLNHVFEHLDNPLEILHNLNMLLPIKGKLLLRFPVIDSFAFEKYKENWVQFDAPRHVNLFTRKSIALLVEKAGNYKIVAMYDDSYHFQFTGSELYLKNLSLKEANNSRIKRLLSLKTYQYHFMAKKLNSQKKGDQIVIILEKI